MEKLTMAELMPFITEAFKKGTEFKLPISGTSMNPFLYENRDFVLLKRVTSPLKLGDVPLYKRQDGTYVLHRVVAIENNTYTLCGDNQFILEKGVTDNQLIGVVSSFIVNGKTITNDSPENEKIKNKYVKSVKYRYPIRRFINLLSKIYHKICRD